MSKKIATLVAWGNPARGDDAAAPMALQAIMPLRLELEYQLRCIEQLQLNPENAFDLQNTDVVIFLDAEKSLTALVQRSISFRELKPALSTAFTSHSQTPENILAFYQRLTSKQAPPAFLLGIGASNFELGQPISENCQENVHEAVTLLTSLLKTAAVDDWQNCWQRYQQNTAGMLLMDHCNA